MQITIKLFASYRIGRFKEADQDYPAGACVGDVLQGLDIAVVRGMVLVNGKPATSNLKLCEGDYMALVPLISGG